MDLGRIVSGASGERKVDLLLKNARIVCVFTGDIYDGHIAVDGDYIVGIGDYEAERCVDLKGRFVAPGFIDSHMHIESSMASVSEFVRSVLPLGTTTVAADPHEIANVLGTGGLDYMFSSSENQPMNVCFTLPSCVPATHMETSGAELTADILAEYVGHEKVLGLGEFMNYPGVINGDPDVIKKITNTYEARKPVDGHAPAITGKELNAYAASGIGSDHECTTVQEALEKIRLGMHIMIREGTCARNLKDLLPVITRQNLSRLMLCTDDRHPQDILDEGHMDCVVRMAIDLGVDPVDAIRMATINPAEYFGIREAGAVAPGRRADLIVFSDIENIHVEDVFCRGVHVASNGKMVPEIAKPKPSPCPAAMSIDMSRVDFSVPAKNGKMRVIGFEQSQVVTDCIFEEACLKDGFAVSDPGRDLLKISVIERYSGKTEMGIGFVRGFGLKQGAIASSVAHDSHNIIVVGANDEDMMLAVSSIVEAGGGFSVVSGGKVRALLPLPIAGLLSDRTMPEIRENMDLVIKAAQDLGSHLHDPFISLGFLSLPVIPVLKITDKGLVDVSKFSVVPLFETEV